MSSLKSIRQKLLGNSPIIALTAYDYTTALTARRAGDIDMIFVLAEEVSKVALGLDSPASLSLDEMLHHSRAVCRGAYTYGSPSDPIVVVELPMGTYEISPEQALTSALTILKVHPPAATGVLLCGGKELVPHIKKLTEAGVLTIVRLGVSSNVKKLQTQLLLEEQKGEIPDCVARTVDSARELLADAQALDWAGASAVVLEGVAVSAAKKLASFMTAPIIGIGSGKDCKGQMCLQSEMLGMGFEKGGWSRWHQKYETLGERGVNAIGKWIKDVESQTFPTKELSCEMKEGEDVQFRQILAPRRKMSIFE